MRSISEQFELARHGDAPNVRPMEGLRGFAVLLVFLVHYVTLISPRITHGTRLESLSEMIHTLGNAGVDLFFVLSGYLIYGSMMARPQRFIPFIRRRISRIYPAFSVVFAMYLVLSFAFPAQNKIPHELLAASIYLLQNFLLLPGLLPIEPMIAVAWSLSYEMFYYLAIPLTISTLHLRSLSGVTRSSFFLAIGAAIVGYGAVAGGPVRLVMFIGGILLYEAMQKRAIRAPRSGLSFAMLAAGLFATTMPFAGFAVYALKVIILVWTFFIVCYSCFSVPGARLAQGFSWTPLRWLGNMSYSYYLIHGLALKLGFTVLLAKVPQVKNETLLFLGLMPFMLVLTLIPAAVLFVLVERPFSLLPARRHVAAPAALIG